MTEEQATILSKRGAYAAFLVAGLTVVAVMSGLAAGDGPRENLFADPLNFVDAGLMALCGVGMLRNSRVAAVIAFSFYLATKILIAAMQDQVAGLFVGAIFLFFFAAAVYGSFRYHQIRKKEDSEYSALPKWMRYVAAPLGLLLVLLIALVIFSETGFLPPSDVVQGDELEQSYVSELQQYHILDVDERIELLYSQGLTSILEAGSLLSDQNVTTWYQLETGVIEAFSIPTHEIQSISFVEEDSDWVDRVYLIDGLDGDWITIVLPTEAEGELEFVGAVRARIVVDNTE